MKKLYFLFILIIAGGSIKSQLPSYGWAKFIGGTDNDYVNGVVVGADQNPIVYGSYYSSTLTIGDTTFNNLYYQLNTFVNKYDGNGNRVWANNVAGIPGDYYALESGNGGSTDINDNFYFTGQYYDTILFGNNIFLPDEYNDTISNAFMVKYNSSGDAQWAQRIHGAVGYNTATDASGNVAMSGIFYFSDSITLADTAIANPDTNGTVSFVIQYDQNGKRLWQQVIDGVFIIAIATDKVGNVYASGALIGAQGSDLVIIGADTLVNTDPTTSTSDIFVVKYSPSGNLLWAEGFGGVTDDQVNAMCVSPNNQLNITGNFDSPELSFGNNALNNPLGAYYTFVARLDSAGSPLWATSAALDNALGITSDAANNLFVSGDYYDTVVVIGADTLHNSSYENMFVLKYDAAGNIDWALTAPGSNDSLSGVYIANDDNGNSYITVNFDNAPVQLGGTTLNPQGGLDVAVAKLDNTGVATGIQQPPANNIRVFPNPSTGEVYFTGLTPGSQIEIYNLLGEKIYTGVSQDETQQLNLNAARGMYIYRVVGNNTPAQSGKIIIE